MFKWQWCSSYGRTLHVACIKTLCSSVWDNSWWIFRKEERKADLHEVPDPRAGEGVSLQSVPDEETEDRDRPRPVPHRKADKDLVPKQTHEMEEGEQEQGRGRLRGRRRRHQSSGFPPVNFPLGSLRSP